MKQCKMETFGKVAANDWPLVCPAKFKLYGAVVTLGFWHQDNPGKAPTFCGQGAAEKALKRLYRKYGHLVSPQKAAAEMRRSLRESEKSKAQFGLIAATMRSSREIEKVRLKILKIEVGRLAKRGTKRAARTA